MRACTVCVCACDSANLRDWAALETPPPPPTNTHTPPAGTHSRSRSSVRLSPAGSSSFCPRRAVSCEALRLAGSFHVNPGRPFFAAYVRFHLYAFHKYVHAHNRCLAGDHLPGFWAHPAPIVTGRAESACAPKHSARSQQHDAARRTHTTTRTSVHGGNTCRWRCTRGLRRSACAPRIPYSNLKSVHCGD